MFTPFSLSTANVSTWKHPSATMQESYHVSILPDGFEATSQEQELLDMYETIRTYEKEAKRLREESARAKLADAAAKYQESTKSISGRKKPRMLPSEDMDDDDENSDNQDYTERKKSASERRGEKRNRELEMKQEKEKEEKLRAELLSGNKSDDEDLGPSLMKRQRNDNDASLISNIKNQETPTHDFSKKFQIKTWEGKILFAAQDEESSWSPPLSASNPNDEALEFDLDSFDVEKAKKNGNNTVVIKYMAPHNSKRFSINISGGDHRQYDNIFFHFNPRHYEKGGQLVLNNKQEGMWGQATNVPLSRMPRIFGQKACTLMIQIHEEGYDVFVEEKHCARLEHRNDMKKIDNLSLQFPATDDRGKAEKWTVYKVWWGHKKLMAQEDRLTGVGGANSFAGLHPKRLFIKGLKPVKNESDIDLRRANFERFFRKYGGARGVTVNIPANSTFAFIECDTEQLADLAIDEMSDQYNIKRARRKKHETLKEGHTQSRDTSEWD